MPTSYSASGSRGHGALLARVQEKATAVETKLLFFELEWAALSDERGMQLAVAMLLVIC